MRRPLDHLLPLGHRRISGSDGNADGRHQQSFFPIEFRDLVKRTFQILLDVVAQCLQRRNVHDLGFVLKRTVQSRSYEPVKTGQKGRQRFARSSRSRDQNIAAGDDLLPGQILSFGRTCKRMLKPFLNDGMKLHQSIDYRKGNSSHKEAQNSQKDLFVLFVAIPFLYGTRGSTRISVLPCWSPNQSLDNGPVFSTSTWRTFVSCGNRYSVNSPV